jgi:hypothetical protein
MSKQIRQSLHNLPFESNTQDSISNIINQDKQSNFKAIDNPKSTEILNR